MEKKDVYFMREALKQAEKALEENEVPVGCVVVHGESKEIVSFGHNETNLSRNGTRHAEIVAFEKLFAACKDTKDVDECLDSLQQANLYVTCEPCIMCAAAIGKLGLKKVYFGCRNDRFGGNGSILNMHLPIEPSSSQSQPQTQSLSQPLQQQQQHPQPLYEIESGLLEDEAIAIFQNFYKNENRRAPEHKRKRKPEKAV